jgi:hypothetical protein
VAALPLESLLEEVEFPEPLLDELLLLPLEEPPLDPDEEELELESPKPWLGVPTLSL